MAAWGRGQRLNSAGFRVSRITASGQGDVSGARSVQAMPRSSPPSTRSAAPVVADACVEQT